MKKSLIINVKTALLALLGFACSAGVYAFDVPADTYYFDNTVTGWDNVYLRIGVDGGYVSVYQMSKVSGNANIYSYTLAEKWEGATAYQFAAYSGYTNGIYDGNWISAGKKSVYLREGDTGSKLYIPTSKDANGYYILDKTQLPSSIGTSYMVVNGTWYDGSGTGHTNNFNGYNFGNLPAGSSITLGGEVSATGGTTDSKVSATMNYCISGYNTTTKSGTFKTLNLPYKSGETAKKQNSTGVSVTIPTDPGQYNFAVYFKCGGVYDSNSSNNYVATYTVPGFAAHGISFGAIATSTTESEDISITDVWGNTHNDGKIEASLSGDTDFSFSSSEASTSTNVTISSNAGTLPIYFTPATSGSKTATLTLTLTYGADEGQTVVKTYSITGYGKSGNPVCHIGEEPTFGSGPTATLNGYLQYTGCNTITKKGFVYTEGTSTPADPTTASYTWPASDGAIDAGGKWSVTTGSLTKSRIYKYRAYVMVGDTKYLSDEIGTFTTTSEDCIYQLSDTVYFTIDQSLDADVPCEFKYRSLETAITKIKSSTFSTSNKLLYNVVFQVVPNSSNYVGTVMLDNKTGGYTDGKGNIKLPNILFEDINNCASPDKVLIVRSSDANIKPSIQHPTVRNSRNIIFDNVRIVGSPTQSTEGTAQYDNAMDIDDSNYSWHKVVSGNFPGKGEATEKAQRAGIVIKHCYIKSSGFTCVHISGYNGITFEDNDIEAELPTSEQQNSNTVLWGASVKMIQCKNFIFLRNNFRGSHATSFWMQGVRGALLMNNVVWNSNNSYNASYANNNATIRLVTQFKDENTSDRPNETYYNKNLNIGVYYNTFYIAENGAVSTGTRYMDFFRVGSYHHNELKRNLDLNTKSSIAFKYNNCYSYDEDVVIGANNSGNDLWCLTDAEETSWCSAGSVTFNNFWSMYDELQENTKSVFGVPSDCANSNSYFINVKELVCTTGAEDPGSLVMKGGDLNLGTALTSSTDKSGLGAEDIFNDRLHPSNGNDAVRKVNGKWTLGAYQQSEGDAPVTTIVWWGGTTGAETDWDNRNNWRKLDGTRVTCIDNIAEDVKVIIPAPTASAYKIPDDGIKYYPVIPNKFTGARTKVTSESVNAGQGIVQKPSKFANNIELEYGAALKNVQSLRDEESVRYDQATNNLVVPRNQWVPVGTVIKPFDKKTGEPRLVISEDYYLYGMPHVYMHEAKISDTQEDGKPIVDWDTPFADLDKEVDYDKVFTIRIPNQYGYYKFTAEDYEAYYNVTIEDPGTAKEFPLTGRFLNDELIPEYKISGNALLCNTLPANVDVAVAADVNHGSFRIWDYSLKRFGSEVEEGTIKPQSGFLFFPNGSNDGYFRITNNMLLNTSTKRGATIQNPYYSIMALNANGDGGSAAAIWLDELKNDVYTSGADAVRVEYSSTPTQPEVYVERYGKELDKLTLPDFSSAIPLTLQLKRKMTVQFSTYGVRDIETAVLEDRETGLKYDLLAGEKCEIALAKGSYQGRFYLNLGAEEEIPTIVDDVAVNVNEIDIYATNRTVVITSSENIDLKEAYITDMSGRTTMVVLKNSHYNIINIGGMHGVYIVKAVGDNMSRTEKVVIK